MDGASAHPSGRQIEIAWQDQRAWIVEVGGGLRAYSAGGRAVLDGYDADEMCSAGRGQCLLPWPNRIRDGRYEFDGTSRQLALSEPEQRNAIHGLVRWASWDVAEQAADLVTMEHLLHPRPGYPHTLELRVSYQLGDDGLTVRTTATNVGERACPFGAGAHPYLAVDTPTVDAVSLRAPGATRLLSDSRQIPIGREAVDGTPYDFRAPRPIGQTVLDTAFTDLERDADGRAWVRLSSAGRALSSLWLDEHYGYLMLFTGDSAPSVDRRSLAVEPMTCAPNAFRSGDGLLTLEPGASFDASFGIVPA